MKKILIYLLPLLLLFISCEDRIFLPSMITLENRGSHFELLLDNSDNDCNEILLMDSVSNTFISLSATKEEQIFSRFKIWQIQVEGNYNVFKIIKSEIQIDTIFIEQLYLKTLNKNLSETNRDNLNLLKITMLDVCQGDCLLIDPPYDNISIVDGGYGSHGYQSWQGGGEKTLVNHLKNILIDSLRYVIETHKDLDHRGGLEDLKNEDFYYEQYITNDNQEFNIGDTLTFSKNCIGQILNFGQSDNLGNSNDENEKSIIFWFNYKNFDMLFTADATTDNEDIILEQNDFSQKKLEILKAPHHGSKYSNSNDFLMATQPIYSLISSGENNPFSHPHEETLTRYKNNQISYFNTAKWGNINILTDGKFFQISNL